MVTSPGGLPWLEGPLVHALGVQRGHALLVHGPEGVGQFELGLALAAAWLCEAPASGRPQGVACGTCPSCHLIGSRSHPDLLVLVPEILADALGWTAAGDEEGGEAKDSKRKPSKDIKVEALRRAVAFAQTTSARGRAKVVLLHPAERMNTISANTLLKTLEEPPGVARFILSTGAPQNLLPTIRSRCQAVPLATPPRDQALAWLRDQGFADGADVMLDACGGQVLRVPALAAEGLDAAAWQRFPVAARQGDASAVAAWPLPWLIDALQKLCHDTLCVAAGAPPRFFAPASIATDVDTEALHTWRAALARIARQAEHPWSAPLMVESLLAQAQRAMRTTPAPRGALNSRP